MVEFMELASYRAKALHVAERIIIIIIMHRQWQRGQPAVQPILFAREH